MVTPGIPNTEETPIVNKLTGKATPVKRLVIFTAAKVKTPVNIPIIALNTGLLAFTAICAITKAKNINATIIKIDKDEIFIVCTFSKSNLIKGIFPLKYGHHKNQSILIFALNTCILHLKLLFDKYMLLSSYRPFRTGTIFL